MDKKSLIWEAAVRPPSILGLNRRSGSVPGEPYPPIKQFDCTVDAASSEAKMKDAVGSGLLDGREDGAGVS
jgi:hypothetical protein